MLILTWVSVALLLITLTFYIAWSFREQWASLKTLRITFFAGVAVFGVLFAGFTWQSLTAMQKSTHPNEITPSVVNGKLAWQKYVCIDCHTILGNGAYYATDLTKAWPRFLARSHGDAETARSAMVAFLLHPSPATATRRGMTQFNMSQAEAESLADFLKWTSRIDTNGWPPPPIRQVAAPIAGTIAGATLDPNAHGERLFAAQGCAGCHSVGGGKLLGPDLAGVAARLDRATLIDFVVDPPSVYARRHVETLNPGYPRMPVLKVSRGDAAAIADYLLGSGGKV